MSELLNIVLNRNQDADYSHYIPKANFVTILLNNHRLIAKNNGTNSQSAFGQYGNTKATSGWSTYADHIVEEGQNLSKSQLRAIEEEQKKSDNGEEMR